MKNGPYPFFQILVLFLLALQMCMPLELGIVKNMRLSCQTSTYFLFYGNLRGSGNTEPFVSFCRHLCKANNLVKVSFLLSETPAGDGR